MSRLKPRQIFAVLKHSVKMIPPEPKERGNGGRREEKRVRRKVTCGVRRDRGQATCEKMEVRASRGSDRAGGLSEALCEVAVEAVYEVSAAHTAERRDKVRHIKPATGTAGKVSPEQRIA
ncbi:hypothetical protein KFK09_002529 [Dendrobium nobile]|uniref:Uncharacterized protein n=1 Tax=Dendrobium nobile TaxID=94219 RepID=A0A8T3C562_DENNO|nr:hypothetical protein KFK09_002529 [Dendrobium nobile]